MFLQHWADETEGSNDSILKHKPIWASYGGPKRSKDKKRRVVKKEGDVYRTYGTRVIPV